MDVADEMETSDDSFNLLDIRPVHDFNALFMESESQGKGTWPCMEPIRMPMDLENCEFRTVANQKFDDKVFKVPAHNKRKDLIKDVVKTHVLPFLPAKSLLKFKSVSKEWDQWISSPLLAHQQSFSFQKISGYFCQHEDSYSKFFSLDGSAYGVPCPFLQFLPGDKRVLGSCNGLLLCQCSESYYVCNPTTEDWKMLPSSVYYHGFDPAVVLAFEPSLQNIEAYYQVICAFSMFGSPVIYFDIYSSATRSWRCSDAICIELGDSSLKGAGFYMNGSAYWETSSGQVLAFNVQNEEHGIISLPSEAAKGGTFTQVGDELCYVTVSNHSMNVSTIDIYGGLDMSLKRSISLNLELSYFPECKVLPGVDGDKLLILTRNGQLCLLSYNLSDQNVELLCKPRGVGFNFRFLPYINSLACVT
nr:F-box protein At5g07610-like [Ipomoea batatas]